MKNGPIVESDRPNILMIIIVKLLHTIEKRTEKLVLYRFQESYRRRELCLICRNLSLFSLIGKKKRVSRKEETSKPRNKYLRTFYPPRKISKRILRNVLAREASAQVDREEVSDCDGLKHNGVDIYL